MYFNDDDSIVFDQYPMGLNVKAFDIVNGDFESLDVDLWLTAAMNAFADLPEREQSKQMHATRIQSSIRILETLRGIDTSSESEQLQRKYADQVDEASREVRDLLAEHEAMYPDE